jgi:hypothetical protein
LSCGGNSAFLDTRVKYQFSTPGAAAPGYPIIGPGAQVQVAHGTTGEVTRLHDQFLQEAQNITSGIGRGQS